ncbi:MAG TPA: NAD-dependent epimerase/dehydratase family protein, partial [Chloroflexota bacterium]|nr:NAD-dependent epimerase/dehydratase family protein [Chloroflexota bacterium]
MSALVLGVGYLGAALTDALCADGERVLGFDNGSAVDGAALDALAGRWPDRFELVRGDLRDAEQVDQAFRRAAP